MPPGSGSRYEQLTSPDFGAFDDEDDEAAHPLAASSTSASGAILPTHTAPYDPHFAPAPPIPGGYNFEPSYDHPRPSHPPDGGAASRAPASNAAPPSAGGQHRSSISLHSRSPSSSAAISAFLPDAYHRRLLSLRDRLLPAFATPSPAPANAGHDSDHQASESEPEGEGHRLLFSHDQSDDDTPTRSNQRYPPPSHLPLPARPPPGPAGGLATHRIVGGGQGNDGVFANLSAKPDGVGSGGEYVGGDDYGGDKDEPLPAYEIAALDQTPPYWETTVITPQGLLGPDDICVDGLPVGNVFSFCWNLLVSMSFQFVGFLLTYLLHTTHAAKNGSRAGLGITLIQLGFYMKQRIDHPENFILDGPGDETGLNGNLGPNGEGTWTWWGGIQTPNTMNMTDGHMHETATSTLSALGSLPTQLHSALAGVLENSDPDKVANVTPTLEGAVVQGQELAFSTTTNEWIAFGLVTVGSFLLIGGCLSYWRAVRFARAAAFLCPRAGSLGYFVSSTPYTSRIIKLEPVYLPNGSHDPGSPTSFAETLTIQATQLVPRNEYALPVFHPTRPLPLLPVGAVLEPDGQAYLSPTAGPGSHTPDAGLATDLLSPTFTWTPLFSIPQGGACTLSSTASSSINTSSRTGVLTPSLRLILHPVHRARPTQSPGDSAENGGAERRRGDSDSAIFALFTGRFPKTVWPTREMLECGSLRSGVEWYGGEIVEKRVGTGDVDAEGGDKMQGWSLVVKRKKPAAVRLDPSTTSILEEEGRRRGVGVNGGPAVLWNGGERDPGARAGVAIIRAGGLQGDGEGPGGFIFHLRQPLRDDDPNSSSPADGSAPEEEEEETVRTDQEEFFPIHPPSIPLGFDSPKVTNDEGDVLAQSLLGIWVGTFGSHGLEFGQLSIQDVPSVDGPLGRLAGSRRLQFIKLTGDINVPSGSVSWYVDLPPSHPAQDGSEEPTVPSITNEKLVKWSAFDPAVPTPTRDIPDWEEGTCVGKGHVAYPGFVNPSWTPATATFIRSTKTFTRVVKDSNGDEVEEERKEDFIEEIRLKWRRLGKVSVFRRVRV
ncbi:metal homeostatis protein bsd2 [Pseudohyphozyma bogoriensis]|nr:metal homeostatis protein bsd2 [Pseudohyphozyma bogoriensis]